MDAFLEQSAREEIAASRLVLESNLRQVVTLSIGQIVTGSVTMTYHRTQRVTRDERFMAVPISSVSAEDGAPSLSDQ